MDDELYMQLLEDASIASYEVDPNMSDREREAFIDAYIERYMEGSA